MFAGLNDQIKEGTTEGAKNCLKLLQHNTEKLKFPTYDGRDESTKERKQTGWVKVPAKENALYVPAIMKGEKLDGLWDGKVIYIKADRGGVTFCHYEKNKRVVDAPYIGFYGDRFGEAYIEEGLSQNGGMVTITKMDGTTEITERGDATSPTK